jgi:gliding motility-associated-like protein
VFEALPAGSYSLLAEDANGCREEISLQIGALAPLRPGPDTYVLDCATPGLTLRPLLLSGGEGPVSYQWSDGSTGPELEVSETGVYGLQVSGRCDSFSLQIQVQPGWDTLGGAFFVPNVFSPNGDGYNDRFELALSPDYTLLDFELQVYDRWGNYLFRTQQPDAPWDGRFRGRLMDPGVYVWQLRARVADCRGREQAVYEKGDVTLVR